MQTDTDLLYLTGEKITAPHWHSEIELVYVVEGQLTLGIEKELISIYEEEIYLIDSGVTHYYLASPGAEYLVLKFNSQLFEQLLNDTEKVALAQTFEHLEPHSRNWPQKVPGQIGEKMLSLYEIKENQESFAPIESLGQLAQLALILLKKLPKKANTSLKISSTTLKNKEIMAKLQQVYQYVDDYFQAEITIETAATILNVSPTYFARFFKKNVGITFHRFLNEHRINQAKFLLSKEVLPMTEIAERSGFSSAKTFHRVFKEVTGLSPLKYQKLIIGKN